MSLLNQICRSLCFAAALSNLSACVNTSPGTISNTTTETIAIQNASFELPATAADSFITTGPPTSWTSYGTIDNNNRAVGVLNPNTTTLYLDTVPDGNNVGVVFLMDNPGDQLQFDNIESGLEQTLTATLETNSTYTLTVQVGNLGPGSPPPPFAFTGFPNYRIELMAGGVVIGQDDNTLLPGEGRFLTSTITVEVEGSHPQEGEALGIRLINLNSAVGIEVNFDDVTLIREY